MIFCCHIMSKNRFCYGIAFLIYFSGLSQEKNTFSNQNTTRSYKVNVVVLDEKTKKVQKGIDVFIYKNTHDKIDKKHYSIDNSSFIKTTDNNGVFSFISQTENTYLIECYKQGYIASTIWNKTEKDIDFNEHIDIELELVKSPIPLIEWNITLIDDLTNQLIKKGTLHIMNKDSVFRKIQLSNGRISLYLYPLESYTIQAKAMGYFDSDKYSKKKINLERFSSLG